MPRASVRLVAACVVIAATSGLAATLPAPGPDALCSPKANPCVVKRGLDYEVTGSGFFDFGGRDVVFDQNSKLEAPAIGDFVPGNLALQNIGSLVLSPGATLRAAGGTITVETHGDIAIERAGSSRATIDVNDPTYAGSIFVSSETGGVDVGGNLKAEATSITGGGGLVVMSGKTRVNLSGDLVVAGGKSGDGGSVDLEASAGPVTISGVVDASGNFGGQITIAAGSSLKVLSGSGRSKLNVDATGTEGDGGEVSLAADGNLLLQAPITGKGSDAGSSGFGGFGAEVDLNALGTITLDADIDIRGAPPGGSGGLLIIEADLDVIQNGHIIAPGQSDPEGFGEGGMVDADAQRNLQLGDIDVTCGACNNCGTCTGGEVVGLGWCDLTLPTGRTIDTRADGGHTDLTSGGTMTIAGRIRSAVENLLTHRSDRPAPVVTGQLEPAAVVEVDDEVPPCGGSPDFACGDGNPDVGEECDDGGRESCDGCSASCREERCGNHRIDCGEVCDDGNDVGCDGCAADCSAEEGVCGDGVLDEQCGEEADPGDTEDCDGVSSTCRIETCGNGRVECDEECDDPGDPECPACRFEPIACGNGKVEAEVGEECDDGNVADCDGCSHACTEEKCGNNEVETCPPGSPVPFEECDDFNLDCGDGCSPDCKREVCGNGIVDCGEPCDDGALNGQPGSQCVTIPGTDDEPATCEEAELCTPDAEGPCIPCASTDECDPLDACALTVCDHGACVPDAPPDCDDHDACTDDACDPSVGCVNTLACDDGDACTDDTCDPASGCAHALVVCDDGDFCTTQACDQALGCVVTTLTGFAAVRCRVDTVEAMLGAAAGNDVHRKARKKIGRFLRRLRTKLLAAEIGLEGGRQKKVARALKGAAAQADKLRRFISKQAGRQVTPALAGALDGAVGDLRSRVQLLRTSTTP